MYAISIHNQWLDWDYQYMEIIDSYRNKRRLKRNYYQRLYGTKIMTYQYI